MPSSGLHYSGKPHVMATMPTKPALKGKDTCTSPFLNQEDLFHHFPMSYFLGESEAKKLCRFEAEFPQHLSSRTCYTLKSSKCCQIWIYIRIPTQKWHLCWKHCPRYLQLVQAAPARWPSLCTWQDRVRSFGWHTRWAHAAVPTLISIRWGLEGIPWSCEKMRWSHQLSELINLPWISQMRG